MTKNLDLPKIMIASVDFVGNKIFKSYKNKKNTLYVPRFWSIIMFFYKIIPEILIREKKIRQKGTKFIFPLPKVKIV